MYHFKCDQCNSDYAGFYYKALASTHSGSIGIQEKICAKTSHERGIGGLNWHVVSTGRVMAPPMLAPNLWQSVARALSFARRVFHSLSYFAAKSATSRR